MGQIIFSTVFYLIRAVGSHESTSKRKRLSLKFSVNSVAIIFRNNLLRAFQRTVSESGRRVLFGYWIKNQNVFVTVVSVVRSSHIKTQPQNDAFPVKTYNNVVRIFHRTRDKNFLPNRERRYCGFAWAVTPRRHTRVVVIVYYYYYHRYCAGYTTSTIYMTKSNSPCNTAGRENRTKV